MAFFTGSSGQAAEINVTPLVDVLLVLLIIFMVIGPKLPHGVDSSIPETSQQAVTSPQEPVTVHVLAGQAGAGVRCKVGEQETTLAELRPVLQRVFATRSEGGAGRAMYVEADRALSYRDVAQVAAAGRAAGAGAIGLIGQER